MTSGFARCSATAAAAASSGYLPSRRSERGCATVMPCCCANCLTGEACSFMPRPAGRSGCVSTSSMEKPASCSRASATSANSGVPANATFTKCGSATFVNPRGGRQRSRPGARSYAHLLARLLDHLRLDAVALERAQVLDEDLAHEVIHLVLHA